MDEGIYELLVTQGVDAGLAAGRLKHQIEKIDKADQPHILARHIGEVVAQRLPEIREPEDRVALANSILHVVKIERPTILAAGTVSVGLTR